MQLGKGNELAMTGKLFARKIGRDGYETNFGVVSVNSVTTVGAEWLVDSFQNSTGYEMSKFIYHGYGTSTGAESTGDTVLGTEVEVRSTGTAVEASSMVFRTVATHTFTTTGGHAITEHGLFSAATTGGTLWDRSKFAAINVSTGDSIEFTYELTVTPGG